VVKFAAATHPTRVRRDAGEAAPAEGSSLKRDIRRGVFFHGKVMQQNKKGTDFLRRCVLFLIGRKAGGYPVFLRKNKGKVLTFTGVNDILIT
jgi:hypothetical protein